MKDYLKSLSLEARIVVAVILILLLMVGGYVAWTIISYIMVEIVLPIAPYLIAIVCMVGVGIVIGVSVINKNK